MLAALTFTVMFNFSRADSITIGMDAPEFALADQTGEIRALKDYQGKWVVLYFYPKDDTPGCTKEACAFRDDYRVISARNTQVLGISIDDEQSHARFARKYQLPFPLLADVGGKVARRYQSLTSLGPLKFAKRHTFVIDPHGKIRNIYRKVDAGDHSKQIMADLESLQSDVL